MKDTKASGMINKVLRRDDLLFPELSYNINGVLFEVFRQLGGGHQERYYQKAVSAGLKARGIKFVEQKYVPLKFNGEVVGRLFKFFNRGCGGTGT